MEKAKVVRDKMQAIIEKFNINISDSNLDMSNRDRYRVICN